MNLSQARYLAHDLMQKHGLSGWSFRFDMARVRFGSCNYVRRQITLSRVITAMNDEAQVRDTILHEIAHALAGKGHGHGIVWKRQALAIGCNGQRCYDNAVVARPPKKYRITCPACGQTAERSRIPTGGIACGRCCRRHNGGRFDARFRFDVQRIV